MKSIVTFYGLIASEPQTLEEVSKAEKMVIRLWFAETINAA